MTGRKSDTLLDIGMKHISHSEIYQITEEVLEGILADIRDIEERRSLGEYIGYREQLLECQKTGNIVRCECSTCNREIVICIRFSGECHSGRCETYRNVKR